MIEPEVGRFNLVKNDRTMKKYFGILILGVHTLVQAAQDIPDEARRELKSTHREFVLKSITMGKLRPGKSNDVVAVIREEESESQRERALYDRTLSYRIVMLKEHGSEKGKYVLLQETRQLGELRGMYEFSVEIRHESLFLHTTSPPGSAIYDYQFKYSHGAFQLVGLEGDVSSSVDGEENVFFKTSVNFLTGVRKDETLTILNGKKKVKRAELRFSLRPVTFENFNLNEGLVPAVDPWR